MQRILVALSVLATTILAATPASADEYKARDELRLAIGDAVNKADAAAFAAHVGDELELEAMWFDTPECRKRFSNAKIQKKAIPALVACLAPLGMKATTLLVRYGPDVIVTLGMTVTGDKAVLTSLKGDGLGDPALPQVWTTAFEEHRTAGTRAITLDDEARAELKAIGERGVLFNVCVGKDGKVASTKPWRVTADSATARQIAAAVKEWRFTPFVVRNKPVTVCTLETVKP